MVCSKTEAIWTEESVKESVLLAGKSRSSCPNTHCKSTNTVNVAMAPNSNIKSTNEDLLLEIEVLNENTILALIKTLTVL